MIMLLGFTFRVESADIHFPPKKSQLIAVKNKKLNLKKIRNLKFLPKIQNYGDSKSNGQVNISQSFWFNGGESRQFD